MIPLVGIEEEFADVKKTVLDTAEKCKAEYDSQIDYLVGTMIEVPRAALTAEKSLGKRSFSLLEPMI